MIIHKIYLDIKRNWRFIALTAIFLLLLISNSFGLNMQAQILLGLLPLPLSLILLSEARSKFKFGRQEMALFFYLIFFTLSLIFSKHPYGFKEFATFFTGSLTFLLFSNFTFKRSLLPAWILVITTSIFSGYGIYEILYTSLDRLDGFFHGANTYSSYPNAMASLLLVAIPINFFLFKKYKFQTQRFHWLGAIALLILNMTAMWLTFSRGALLGLAVISGAALALYITHEKKFKKILLNALLGILIFALGFLFTALINTQNAEKIDVSERITSEDVSSKASVNERFEFFSGSLLLTKDNPLFGVGPGGFQYFYPKYQTTFLENSEHPHNVILKIFSESGILAGLAFTIFILFILINGILEIIWIKKRENFAYSVLFISFLGLTFHNLIDYNLNFALLSLLFFSLAGLLTNESLWDTEVDAIKQRNIKAKIYKTGYSAIAVLVVLTSLLEGYGYSQIKVAVSLSHDNKVSEALKTLDKAAFIPFKTQYYELKNQLTSGDKSAAVFGIDRYPAFHPLHFYKALKTVSSELAQKSDFDILTEYDSKNYLSYYYMQLLFTAGKQDQKTIESREAEIKGLLSGYTELLRTNSHQTVASMNPYVANQMYIYYLTYFQSNEEKFSSWKVDYATFSYIWQTEIKKFNDRFGTKLTVEQPDETINSYF